MALGSMFINSFIFSIHLILLRFTWGLGPYPSMLMVPRTAAKKTDDYITYIMTYRKTKLSPVTHAHVLEDHYVVCACLLPV